MHYKKFKGEKKLRSSSIQMSDNLFQLIFTKVHQLQTENIYVHQGALDIDLKIKVENRLNVLAHFLAMSCSSFCCSSSLVSCDRRLSEASTSWRVRRLLVAGGKDLLSSKNILTVSDTSPLKSEHDLTSVIFIFSWYIHFWLTPQEAWSSKEVRLSIGPHCHQGLYSGHGQQLQVPLC